jgi:hypothetical protein
MSEPPRKSPAAELTDQLQLYATELGGILERFRRDQSGIHIRSEDDVRFKQLVLELRDLFNDNFPGQPHASDVIRVYNEGGYSWAGGASLRCVEDTRGIVRAVIQRLKVNPGILAQKQPKTLSSGKAELTLPEKVTVKWLIAHVPAPYWLWMGGSFLAVFALGYNACRFLGK